MEEGKKKRPLKTKQKPIRLLVVDDHEVVRVGLRTLLNLVPGIKVVGEVGSADEAVRESIRLKPDVVLLDIRLPDRSGVEACQEILGTCPDTRVLFLTSFADDETVLAAVLSGAHGYILKEMSTQPLVEAIRSVAAGHYLLHQDVTKQTMKWLRTLAESGAKGKAQQLSAQERRVLALVAEGKTNKEIAYALNLSDKTVKNYLANVYEKLHISRRSQAAALYTRKFEGLKP